MLFYEEPNFKGHKSCSIQLRTPNQVQRNKNFEVSMENTTVNEFYFWIKESPCEINKDICHTDTSSAKSKN